MALFGATAGVGAWIAYDRPSAIARLLLIFSGLVLTLAMAWFARRQQRQTLYAGVLICVGATVLVSLAYLTRVFSDSVMTGGSLLVLLPIVAGGGVVSWRHGHRTRAVGMLLVVALGLAVLVLTVKVSAWFGLLGGCAVAGIWMMWANLADVPDGRKSLEAVVSLVLLVGVVLYGIVLFTPALDADLAGLAIGPKLMSRVELWRDSLALIRDYLVTGSGLGSTAMVYSTYIYFLHVPYFYHAHNLYLQIAIEQGILGLIAFGAMSLGALWGLARVYSQTTPGLRSTTLGIIASLSGLLVYGLFDSDLYVSPVLPVMFIPVGVALVIQARQYRIPDRSASRPPRQVGGATWILLVLAASVACFGWLLTPGGQSRVVANWGAVAQTQAELSVYRGDDWPIQDLLRLDNAVDLSQAETLYAQALQLDVHNVTAHRRLGQIALSRGDFASARMHLETAHLTNPADVATRRLLGEVYAVTGLPDAAVLLWRDLEAIAPMLQTRLWWYASRDAQPEAQGIRQAIERLQRTTLYR